MVGHAFLKKHPHKNASQIRESKNFPPLTPSLGIKGNQQKITRTHGWVVVESSSRWVVEQLCRWVDESAGRWERRRSACEKKGFGRIISEA